MPAWNATSTWDLKSKGGYRQYVSSHAEAYRWQTQDCADLSMSLLIDYAEDNKLPLTFRNDDGWIYSSREDGSKWASESAFMKGSTNIAAWKNKDEYKEAVWEHINVRDLWLYNTAVTNAGLFMPSPGDLLMIYEKGWVGASRHHCALIYRTYAPGAAHPKENDMKVPNFPGGQTATNQGYVTEYFRGDTYLGQEGTFTFSRRPGKDWHFDYLNHRGVDKKNAEILYFANAKDFKRYGFEFRMYTDDVLK